MSVTGNEKISSVGQTFGRASLGVKRRLSSKLLWLTFLFVMIAEVLIFVPSVANFRIVWLEQRLNTAAATSILVLAMDKELPRDVQDDVLMATGAKTIALRRGGRSELLVVSEMPPNVDLHVEVTEFRPIGAIIGAFDTLLFGGGRNIHVSGPLGEQGGIEMIYPETPLRHAMFTYARNIGLISLVIAFIAAALVFVALNRIMIRPVRNVTGSMLAFGAEPENTAAIIRPTGRNDELGIIETELASMQRQLHATLKGQKRLADLGLAVSKINHDMRNVLASAQLLSDRLTLIDEPSVQRFAPKLIRSIDRAVAYTTDVLHYGSVSEKEPVIRLCSLAPIVADVESHLGLDSSDDIIFEAAFASDFKVHCDPEFLFRILLNLSRNAVQAMRDNDEGSALKRLSISAVLSGETSRISVRDTGPGLPAKARENLFSAFKGSARNGGTGLGLAIASELAQTLGGTLSLCDDQTEGTHFEICLPASPRDPIVDKIDKGR